MIRKILKWTGLILLFLAAGITIITASRQHLKYEAPFPVIKVSKDSLVIAQGKHLVFGAAHCINCHSGANADSLINLGLPVDLTGGFEFDLPVGKIYSKNITPDIETGIGKYTDEQIARLLRYGVRPDGTAVFDFMPFHNMSDEDLTAVISYLRAQRAVKKQVPANTLNGLGYVVNAFMVKPVGPEGEVPKAIVKDSSVGYGKYIAMSVANCNGCHTLRDMAGAYIGEPFAGGGPFEEPGKPTLYPPNITPDSSSRIFGWSEQDFIRRFRMGKSISYSHMPWDAFKRMDNIELKAVYRFLKTVQPAKTPPVKPKA